MAQTPPRPSLFVVLTEDEADGVLRDPQGVAGSRGLAKIRSALHGARVSPETVPDLPPLRAHDYRPAQSNWEASKPAHRRSVAVDPPVQPHARPGPRGKSSSSSSSSSVDPDDDYTPWRDEGHGIWLYS